LRVAKRQDAKIPSAIHHGKRKDITTKALSNPGEQLLWQADKSEAEEGGLIDGDARHDTKEVRAVLGPAR
jgi:hypothetical protein